MTPTRVRLWVDPSCPWAWQGAVWLRRLVDVGRVELEWRIFSLELNSSERDIPFWEACQRHGESLVALALARREGGDEAFERLYVALARRLHDEHQEPSAALARSAAAEAGLTDLVERAIAKPELAEEVRREFQDARDQSVFGVPTLAIADSKVFYGPVMARAPEGEDAERMWEHIVWLAERDDFFELKRWPRGIRPGETGPRSVGETRADP